MTMWTELRTVALVGTERRVLPPNQMALLKVVPEDDSAELRALHLAAILGMARRGGAPVTTADAPPASDAVPVEAFAGSTAVQLLELILTGNAGPGSMGDQIFEQWFERCADLGLVVPHRHLVGVLNYATTTSRLRPNVASCLGARGHWLASQREIWSWAVPTSAISDQTNNSDTPASLDLDELLQLPSDQRDGVLLATRAGDARVGRQLIAESCARLDAASRARVLALLDEHLTSDDEEILEAALDDRSKGVRTAAISMLNRLTSSARAARLSQWLDPHVSKSGKVRKTITLVFPSAPEGEQLRDLPPTGRGVVEQQWFDALVTGAPLAWWEDKLEMTPSKIVDSKLSHDAELLHAWSQAAIAQQNQTWLEALFAKTENAALVRFITADAAAAAFLASIRKKTNDQVRVSLLSGADRPWDARFSQQVVSWARDSNGGKGAVTRMNMAQTMMSSYLSTSTQPQLESWLEDVRGEEDQALQRLLRNLIQQLSFKTSIDKAFT